MPRDADNTLRLLDATELLRTLHVFLRRLEKGEPAADLGLGIDCLDSACRDMLQRLQRVYAQTATRRHSRIKRHETVMICAGIGALHFFLSGQKPFALAATTSALTSAGGEDVTVDVSPPGVADEDYVALDEPAAARASGAPAAPESFRIDRWHVRDVSPQGLLITQEEESGVRFRIGDVLGIQRTSLPGHWSVGLVRWFRAHGEKGIEVGVELAAPDAQPASVRPVDESQVPSPALLLPPVDAVHRPATLLVARGAIHVGKDCFLASTERGTRRVRPLDSLEHTNAVEQFVIGDVIA
jgi:hypothetical protein